MASRAALFLLAQAAAAEPGPADLLARGLVAVERRAVVNPYAGIAREELVFEGGGERWRCLRWSDGTVRCVCESGPEGRPCS